MLLTPTELERLTIFSAAELARKRKGRGCRLNAPEAIALISDEILKEDKSILEDLILAAHNNAKEKLKSKTTEEISKATGGFGIPGFKWPLT